MNLIIGEGEDDFLVGASYDPSFDEYSPEMKVQEVYKRSVSPESPAKLNLYISSSTLSSLDMEKIPSFNMYPKEGSEKNCSSFHRSLSFPGKLEYKPHIFRSISY